GGLVAKRARLNEPREQNGYLSLDTNGIEAWLIETLREFARMGQICAIFPVGHGAAAAIIRDGGLAVPPMDYEQPLPADIANAYREECDLFRDSGSPALPAGLNLGAQLYWLQRRQPELLK